MISIKNEPDSLTLSTFTIPVTSVLGYELGMLLKRKFKLAVFNPLLISIIFVIICLGIFNVDYESYNKSAQYLGYLLTPATVCLDYTRLYQQIRL